MLVYRSGNAPVVEDVPDTLEALQAIVGGPIEGHPLAPDVMIICHGDGKLLGLPKTARWERGRLSGHASDLLVGNFVVTRTGAGGESVDLLPVDIEEAYAALVPVKP